jgi:O-succinylbenzoic acid--CoA ligase
VLKELIFLTENKNLQQEVQNFLSEWRNSSDEITIKTSGSTGNPKIYTIKKSLMRISARKTLSTFFVPVGGTALLCLSTETIAGKMMVVRAAENTMTLYVSDVRSNALCDLPISSVDLTAIVPLQLEQVLHCHPSLLKNCTTVLLGGGSISSEHMDALKKHQATVYHTYGMTETLSHIAYRRVGKVTEDTFTPLDGVKISAENGCLKIDYPELGIEGLKTNDLVEIAPNGQFKILGRADFIINSGGIKFNPEELESLISHAIQEPFFIGGLPDMKSGERVVIVIEGAKKDAHSSLLDRIKPLLPLHSCPKEIYYVPEFMRTESLKIRRKETMSLL